MCLWTHEGSGNVAKLEEQSSRPLFLQLFCPFCALGMSQVTHTHPAHLPVGMGCRAVQMGPPETCALACCCSQKGEPNHEQQGHQ